MPLTSSPRRPWILAVPLLGAILSLSCGGELRTIDVSQAGDAVIAVVTLDGAGRPVRVLPPFGVLDGALDFGKRPQAELQDLEVGAAWIRLSREVIEAQFPGAWPRRHEIQLARQAPPVSPTSVVHRDGQAWLWTAALPAGAQVVGGDAPTLRDTLAISIVQDAEPCRDPQRGPLVPYASTARPMPNPDSQYLSGLVVLNATTAVVAGDGVYILRRGQPLDVERPGDSLSKRVLFDGGQSPATRVEELRLDPDTANRADRRLFALVAQDLVRTALVELALDERGLRWVRSATVVETWMRALSVGPAGQIAAAGDGGVVVRSDDGGRTFVRHDLPGDGRMGNKTRRVLFTSNPDEPLLATTVDQLVTLNPVDDRWALQRAYVEGTGTVFDGLEASQGEVWLGGSAGRVLRRDRNLAFVEPPLRFPPQAGVCAEPHGTEPRWVVNRDVSAMALNDEGPIIAYKFCSALYHLRAGTEGCVATLGAPEGNGPIQAATYVEIAAWGEQIVVSDSLGGVFISEPRLQ